MKQKKPAKSQHHGSFDSLEIEQIEQLLEYMAEHNLEEFEYSRGDLRIRLRKPAAAIMVAPSAPARASESAIHRDAPLAAPPASESRPTEDLHIVKSPIVGTYYGAPSPEADPFVRVGSQIQSGQTLCIVEAMKLMNEIEADASGEIVRIFAENGQPVEYGQALFGIRTGRKK